MTQRIASQVFYPILYPFAALTCVLTLFWKKCTLPCNVVYFYAISFLSCNFMSGIFSQPCLRVVSASVSVLRYGFALAAATTVPSHDPFDSLSLLLAAVNSLSPRLVVIAFPLPPIRSPPTQFLFLGLVVSCGNYRIFACDEDITRHRCITWSIRSILNNSLSSKGQLAKAEAFHSADLFQTLLMFRSKLIIST